MIHHFTASVTFTTPTKNIPLRVDFSPQPGITAVIGRNGTGKSWSVIEVPRFLLFGKKALRGPAGGYKTMTAKGDFVFKGRRYTIERTPKHESITDVYGTVLAVGAEAVTAKVVELLGYGLEVFDLCNASVQKKTDRFGQMRPAERKTLVDKLIGLSDYQTVEKTCREEATGYRREAEAMAKLLRAPGAAPEKPEGFRAPDMIQMDIDQHNDDARCWAELNAQVYRGMPPIAPLADSPDQAELDRLERHERDRVVVEQERRRLQSIMQNCRRFVPDALPEAELVKAEARNVAKRAIEQRGPAPRFNRADTEAMWAAWAVYDAHNPSEEVQCPSCGTSFRPTGEAPAMPSVDKLTLRDDGERQSRWAHGAEIALPAGPDLTDQQIKLMRESNAATKEHDDAATALAALNPPVNQSRRLAELRGLQVEWAVYDEKLAEHGRRAATGKAAEAALEALGPRPTSEALVALQQALRDAEGYIRDLARYETEKKRFEEDTAKVTEATEKAAKFKAGADALADARATLKAHLAPLLSRVATSLIYDMTAGELTSVVVDDDMEITVDGQAIETLSGAGETVANLALRIGLGQVLVANTFPVFLGDEIDSDADDQRRAATKLAIQSLANRLDQIILVSHRQIDIADHILDLDTK